MIELETLLKEEIKQRNKTEKRLKFMKKKLESSKTSSSSERSSSSENSKVYCISSTSTSAPNDPGEEIESKFQVTSSVASQESSPNDSETAISDLNHENPSTSSPEEFCQNPSQKSQDSKPDYNR